MSDILPSECPPADDASEKEFRKKNQYYSFTGHLYSALGGAAFIGLLGTMANALVKVAAGGEVGAAASALFAATPLAVMGGLMVLGSACIYMAQRQFTELKCLGDEHLAVQNAKKMGVQAALPAVGIIEHKDHERADGRSWQEFVSSARSGSQQHTRV